MNGNGNAIIVLIRHSLTFQNDRLRIHATQEWHDLYQESNNDELQLFFDRFAKGLQNDFENKTPKVRVSLLGFNQVYSF